MMMIREHNHPMDYSQLKIKKGLQNCNPISAGEGSRTPTPRGTRS